MLVKFAVHWHKDKWDDKYRLAVFSGDMSFSFPEEYILAGEFEVDLPIATLDEATAVAAEVSALNAKKRDLLAKVDEIEDRIASLACLDHKV